MKALSDTGHLEGKNGQERSQNRDVAATAGTGFSLYTAEQKKRRDESIWTLVQGVLAPFQFVVFAISLFLVIRFLQTGEGEWAADASIFAKTMILYTIMITGSIWEKVVFGKWLFAKAFFWEDVFSMAVLGLHTLYIVMLFNGWGSSADRMYVALAAYFTYAINAAQFIYKLRLARLSANNLAPADNTSLAVAS